MLLAQLCMGDILIALEEKVFYNRHRWQKRRERVDSVSLANFKFVRSGLLSTLSTIAEEQVDRIPEGFNNSIRWNVGHVLLMADELFSLLKGYERVTPETYKEFFHLGTSPKTWAKTPPAWQELVEGLEKQAEKVEKLLEKEWPDLHAPLKIREYTFATSQDVMAFVAGHEGLHHGIIKVYAKL